MESKAGPSAVSKLVQGTRSDAQRDVGSSSSTSSSSTNFRTTTTNGWTTGTDDDFGRFSNAQQPFVSQHTSRSRPQAAAVESFDALLANGSLTDQVYGDWEQELLEKQSKESSQLPKDPLASRANGYAKGKQRATATTPGYVSPTTREMISDLESLDLASREYLRSLVALPEDQSIIDYIEQNRYTEDVYGLPDGVKRLVDKAKQDEDQVGREKAVARLRMVLSHML